MNILDYYICVVQCQGGSPFFSEDKDAQSRFFKH